MSNPDQTRHADLGVIVTHSRSAEGTAVPQQVLRMLPTVAGTPVPTTTIVADPAAVRVEHSPRPELPSYAVPQLSHPMAGLPAAPELPRLPPSPPRLEALRQELAEAQEELRLKRELAATRAALSEEPGP